jgi:hypothetical protein
MNKQIHIVVGKRPENQLTYLGYINGRLTRFFLKHNPSTDEYVKVEVAA